MILYTPMQLELVLDGLQDSAAKHNEQEIAINNGRLVVANNGDGTGNVVRLISTNPYDYMRADYMPGALIRF